MKKDRMPLKTRIVRFLLDLWYEIKDIKTLIIFFIVLIIMLGPTIFGYTMFAITKNQFHTTYATAYILFWNAVPFTPFFAIVIIITLALRRLLTKIILHRYKKKRAKFPSEFYTLTLNFYDTLNLDFSYLNRRDPYQVYVHEEMLKVMPISLVKEYFINFITEIKNIDELAEASEEKLISLWSGLGYFSVVRNMKKVAIKLKSKYNSEFPKDYKNLLKLKGINSNIASAILSEVYDLKKAIINDSTLKVYVRVLKDDSDIGYEVIRRQYKELVENIMDKRPQDFNSAIRYISENICLSSEEPKCDICPFKDICKARFENACLKYPLRKKNKKEENISVFLAYDKFNNILLRKRKSKGLFRNMYELVYEENFMSLEDINLKFEGKVKEVRKSNLIDHEFSKKIWHMQSYIVTLDDYTLKEDEIFASPQDLDEKYLLPVEFMRFIKE